MKIKHDLVVVGGGLSGVAAAVSAARRGLSVIILEKGNCFGGAASNSLVHPFMLFRTKEKVLCRGIFEEIGNELSKKDKFITRGNDTFFHDEYMKLVLNRMVINSGADILFHAKVIDVVKEGEKITQVVVSTPGEKLFIEADYFIDATGDADIAYKSGCGFTLGRGDGLCQPMTLCFRLVNVDTAKINRLEINNLYKEKQQSGEIKNLREDVLMFKTLMDGVMHFNTTRIVKLNPTDIFDITKAEIDAREQVYEIFEFLKENFEAFKNSEIIVTAPEIGIRESRMINGEYVLTGDDLKDLIKFEDRIALGNYEVDIHNPEGTGTSHYFFKDGEYYSIPYRSLLPKEVTNLVVVGRCISANHEAQAAIRIMPIVCCVGQAGGTAVVVAKESGKSLNKIDVSKLQEYLKADGADID